MEFLDSLLIEKLGLVKPWQRVVAVGGAVYAAQYVIQPSWAYQDGISRPFVMTVDPEEPNAVDPTIAPWWVLPALVGGLAGLVI
jgi:hypothetical protein